LTKINFKKIILEIEEFRNKGISGPLSVTRTLGLIGLKHPEGELESRWKKKYPLLCTPLFPELGFPPTLVDYGYGST
jgi:hypothetical protein